MSSQWVWFDLENSPHVHFLAPLIRGVRAAGFPVRLTARPQAQTLELAALHGMPVQVIGGGDLPGKARKVAGIIARALRLAAWSRSGNPPALLVSSSRSACLAAVLTRTRSVALLDYEHAEHRSLALSESLWCPDLLRGAVLSSRARAVAAFYEGLKENLYLDERSFNRADERRTLGLVDGESLVLARPPADDAHYHRGAGWDLWLTVCRRVLGTRGLRLVVMPRTGPQGARVRDALGPSPQLRVLSRAVDGPAIVVAADLVVGGGGTMNREAAVLGTPVWSVFTGPRPIIDETLAHEGRLQWITDTASATHTGFPFSAPRRPRGPYPAGLRQILADILRRIDHAARQAGPNL